MSVIHRLKVGGNQYDLGTVHYIEGTGTVKGKWVGSDPSIASYYTGLTIAYKMNVEGTSDTTLNINGLGEIPVYANGNILTTPIGAVGSVLILTFDGNGVWQCSYSNESSDRKTSSGDTDDLIYLIGAKAQSPDGQTTFSNDEVFVDTEGHLNDAGGKVANIDHYHSISGDTKSSVGKVSSTTGEEDVSHSHTVSITSSDLGNYTPHGIISSDGEDAGFTSPPTETVCLIGDAVSLYTVDTHTRGPEIDGTALETNGTPLTFIGESQFTTIFEDLEVVQTGISSSIFTGIEGTTSYAGEVPEEDNPYSDTAYISAGTLLIGGDVSTVSGGVFHWKLANKESSLSVTSGQLFVDLKAANAVMDISTGKDAQVVNGVLLLPSFEFSGSGSVGSHVHTFVPEGILSDHSHNYSRAGRHNHGYIPYGDIAPHTHTYEGVVSHTHKVESAAVWSVDKDGNEYANYTPTGFMTSHGHAVISVPKHSHTFTGTPVNIAINTAAIKHTHTYNAPDNHSHEVSLNTSRVV